MSFSVSICVYAGDDPTYFEIAVQSVVHQTLPPDEIVLTVDGPIPNETEATIERIGDQLAKMPICFKMVRLPDNRGHGEARRVGVDACSHELVALMDADDLSVPERFEKQISYFEKHPEVSAVGGQITEFITADDPLDVSRVAGNRIVPLQDADIKAYMKKRCPMNQVTVMFRRSDAEAAGGFQDWFYEEDYYLWLRMALAGMRFGNLEDMLVHVRVGEEMYQRRGGLKYFQSEAKLQKYMLKNKVISPCRFFVNVAERLLVQVLMPNRLRGWVFQKLARS